jgi:ADP-ribosylglycohydrolase
MGFKKDIILGAIAGDVIGSVFEHSFSIPKDFELFSLKSKFTDDTVLTIAVLDCLLNDNTLNFEKPLKSYTKKYFNSGFGPGFENWVLKPSGVKGFSCGNGAAMRISALGALIDDENILLKCIKDVTNTSHNHEESVKGAVAIGLCIFKAKNGFTKQEINEYVTSLGYELNSDFEAIKQPYRKYFGNGVEYICQTTVPIAISCFLQTNDYESCIRLAISSGGDTDTVACMAGGIAAAFYGGIPQQIKEETLKRIPEEFKDILNMI